MQLKPFVWACWGLLLLAARPTSAQAPAPAAGGPVRPAAEPGPLDGFWKGPLKVPGGSLEVIFRFLKLTSGDYFGTLDVPLQKVSHLEVQVTQRNDTVQLYAPAAGSRFVGVLAAGGQQLVGTWQQPGYKVAMALAHSAVPVAAAASTRLTPPYREENVTFGGGAASARLAGTFTVPAGPGPFPAVVLVSDAGVQDRNGAVDGYAPLGQLADYLTRRGIAVLRFDDRGIGQGGAPGPEPTAAELVSDAQAGLSFLRNRPEADSARLGLIGHGEGGNVALLAAAQPLPPAFVVALAAAGLPGRELVLQQQSTTLRQLGTDNAQVAAIAKRQQAVFDIIGRTPDNALARVMVTNLLRQSNSPTDAATAQRRAAEMTTPRYRYFLEFDPAANLKFVACPVLLLNGTADGFVSADANLAALEKGLKANKGVTVKKLPGVNHLFQPEPGQWPVVAGQPKATFSPLAEETIRAWITERGPAKK
ncbi:alpha/beta hydrolase family protein [Hymenobacter nivis]|nr:alpha/beta hydrolase [Hymenobacter nivis]